MMIKCYKIGKVIVAVILQLKTGLPINAKEIIQEQSFVSTVGFLRVKVETPLISKSPTVEEDEEK